MVDSITSGFDYIWDIIKWIFLFLIGMFSFLIKKISSKVEDHDKNHVPRKEFNETIAAMRRENKENYEKMYDKIDNLPEKILKLTRLANINKE